MHRAALKVLGLPHDYFAFLVRNNELEPAIAGAKALGMGGLNLTVPHKKAGLEVVDVATETAQRIGAVNTVIFKGGRSVGDNTDGIGFSRAVRELGGPTIKRAVVLGAGGASRAIVDALRHPSRPANGAWSSLRDPVRIRWVSRQPDVLPERPGVTRTSWDDINEIIRDADLLVNATTVGMPKGPVGFPVPVDPSRLPEDGRVIDIVYPRPTWGLLDAAEQAGKQVQDGLPMLLWQGVAALELWLKRTLPTEAVDAMRKTLNSEAGESVSHT